jgi:hypothetical protein
MKLQRNLPPVAPATALSEAHSLYYDEHSKTIKFKGAEFAQKRLLKITCNSEFFCFAQLFAQTPSIQRYSGRSIRATNSKDYGKELTALNHISL